MPTYLRYDTKATGLPTKRAFTDLADAVVNEDLFGREGQAADYAAYRPSYNNECFSLLERYLEAASYSAALAGHARESVEQEPPALETTCRNLAVDVGTGSGQIALPLRARLGFERVIGIDKSVEQLKHAKQMAGVEYREGNAYSLPVESNSVDLVTIAQTLHWLDFAKFFAEVNRVLKPTGTFAVLGYAHPRILDPDLDKEFKKFYIDFLGSREPKGAPENYWEFDRCGVVLALVAG